MSSTSGTVSVSVSGLFHYQHYIEYLARQCDLQGFYFSHRLNTTFQLRPGIAHNFFLKEYLTGLHVQLLGSRWLTPMLALYHLPWRWSMAKKFQPADVNLFMLHGNCIEGMRKARDAGKLVIGEAVNQHPRRLREILSREASQLGLSVNTDVVNATAIAEEVQLCDLVICPSAAVARSYEAEGVHPAKIRVVPYGSLSQPAVASRAVPNSAAVSILVVAQLNIRKGIHHLLNAVRQNASLKGTQITVVGRGDPVYREYLLSLYSKLDIIPHVPHHQMHEFMRSFAMTCLPSIEDGFGMVVSESIAADVPVLVSQFAGSSELVSRYGGGLIYDPHDYHACEQAIGRLVNGEYQAAERFPTWNDYAMEVDAVFRDLKRGKDD